MAVGAPLNVWQLRKRDVLATTAAARISSRWYGHEDRHHQGRPLSGPGPFRIAPGAMQVPAFVRKPSHGIVNAIVCRDRVADCLTGSRDHEPYAGRPTMRTRKPFVLVSSLLA